MSYVLARKWRPHRFDQLIGQTATITALQNALQKNRLHHAYLFTGTRGVGKTTLARILAMCLNCETTLTDTPCGTCSACLSIQKGHNIDVMEVDAASRTKVEDTREILDNVQYSPNQSRFKVYIIDEVHMLSTHSFNALLKTLEEPPAHVKFLLATTDPQKLPATVLSRCMQFHLEALETSTLSHYFQHVLTTEQIDFEPDAIDSIAHAASGSVRDGLSLLDQAIALCHETSITTTHMTQMLGSISDKQIHTLLSLILSKEAKAVIELAQSLVRLGAQCQTILKQLLNTLHAVACHISVPEFDSPIQLDTVPHWSERTLTEHIEWIHLLYQIALSGQRDIPLAPTPQQGLEITLLRMTTLMPEMPTDTQLPWCQTHASTASNAPSKITHTPQTSAQHTAPSTQKQTTPPPITTPTDSQKKEQKETHTPMPQIPFDAEHWHQWVQKLSLPGMTQSLAEHTGWHQYQNNELTLMLHKKHQALITTTRIKHIETGLKQFGYTSIRVHIHTSEDEPDSLQLHKQTLEAEKPKKALAALEEDQALQTLLDTFDGKLNQPTLKDPQKTTP